MLCLLLFILSANYLDAINLKSDMTIPFSRYYIPQYLEANQSFPQAKFYIRNNLPKNANGPENVTHKELAFAGLVAILGGLVESYTIDPKRYEPADLIQDFNVKGKNNYNQVVEATNKLLEEATTKVRPIINLLNSLCIEAPYGGCDKAVDTAVRSNFIYYMPARLFVHLGKISKNILKNQVILDRMLNNDEVISYLSSHANDSGIMKIIKKLSKVYVLMKNMDAYSYP